MPKQEIKKSSVNNSINQSRDPFSYILLASFAMLVIFFTTSKISNEDDMFWHLSIGRYIVENKSVPSTDIFSYTTTGQEWIPFEWGWDVINYLLYNFGGYKGIYLFNSFIFLFIFLTIYLTARKFGASDALICLIFILFLFGIFERLLPRPQILGYLFTTVIMSLFILSKYFYRNKIWFLYFLPLIFLIWVNVHMGVLAGIIIFILFLISEYLQFFKPSLFQNSPIKPLTKQNLAKLSGLFILSLISLLLNPHGIHTFTYVYSHLNMQHIHNVSEWVSTFDSRFVGQFITIFYFIFLGVGLIILYYSYKKKDFFAASLYIIFGINSTRAIRFTIDYLFAIIIYFIISAGFLLTLIKNEQFKKFLFKNYLPKIIVTIICIFLIINIPNNKLYTFVKYPRIYGSGIEPSFFPVQMFDFIKRNNIENLGEKLFNTYECGGFFTWNFPGKLNFIDSRAVNENILSEYDTLFSKLPGYDKKIKSYGFDYAICTEHDMVRTPQCMSEFIMSYFLQNPNEWKLVFWNDKSMLFLKNLPKFQPIIDEYEYKYINPYNFVYQKQVIETAVIKDREQVMKELNRKYYEEPSGFYINYIIKTYKDKL